MRRQISLAVLIGLIASFSAAQANADRFFQIQVKQIAGGTAPSFNPPFGGPENPGPNTPGPNCYSFLDDGTWIDPLFFVPADPPIFTSTWEETANGVISYYTATAIIDLRFFNIPLVFKLVQNGQTTPSFGAGQVRLTAFSTFTLTNTEAGEIVDEGEFVSTGYEVDACPAP